MAHSTHFAFCELYLKMAISRIDFLRFCIDLENNGCIISEFIDMFAVSVWRIVNSALGMLGHMSGQPWLVMPICIVFYCKNTSFIIPFVDPISIFPCCSNSCYQQHNANVNAKTTPMQPPLQQPCSYHPPPLPTPLPHAATISKSKIIPSSKNCSICSSFFATLPPSSCHLSCQTNLSPCLSPWPASTAPCSLTSNQQTAIQPDF